MMSKVKSTTDPLMLIKETTRMNIYIISLLSGVPDQDTVLSPFIQNVVYYN
jgi:hypothetical protein